MNILLLVGISGSGKSTWAKTFLQTHPDYICINRDTLRLNLVKTLDGYYKRPDVNKLEGIVNILTEVVLMGAEQQGYNVLVDNTNLTLKYINNFINYNGVQRVTWQYKLFNIRPEAAKIRVINRDHDSNFACNDEEIDHLIEQVAYIDKQYFQYKNIKQILLTHYINNEYAENNY